MEREQNRSWLTLALFAALSVTWVGLRLGLRQEPTEKGICSFCNGPYKAMVLGAYGVVP